MPSEFPVVHPDAGVARQVLSKASELMVVSFRFEVGAQGRCTAIAMYSRPIAARGAFASHYQEGNSRSDPETVSSFPQRLSTAAPVLRLAN